MALDSSCWKSWEVYVLPFSWRFVESELISNFYRFSCATEHLDPRCSHYLILREITPCFLSWFIYLFLQPKFLVFSLQKSLTTLANSHHLLALIRPFLLFLFDCMCNLTRAFHCGVTELLSVQNRHQKYRCLLPLPCFNSNKINFQKEHLSV